VDTADALKAPIASPTFTGTVTLPGNPSSANHAVNKTYADLKAPIASPTFTGTVTLPADPTAALHAATKQYADAQRTYQSVVITPGTGSVVFSIPDGWKTVRFYGANIRPTVANQSMIMYWQRAGQAGIDLDALYHRNVIGRYEITPGGAMISNWFLSEGTAILSAVFGGSGGNLTFDMTLDTAHTGDTTIRATTLSNSSGGSNGDGLFITNSRAAVTGRCVSVNFQCTGGTMASGTITMQRII
jgi:hypothetical protein